MPAGSKPALAHPLGGSTQAGGQRLRFVGIVVLLAAATLGCGRRPAERPSAAAPASASVASQEVDPAERRQASGYVGLERCAACHRQRVAEVRQTRHFLACVAASDVPMPAGFESGRNRYQSQYPGLSFEMSRADGQYRMSAVRQTPQGAQRRTSSIDLVYGHGAGTDEAYFSWQPDGRVFELPMVWLHPQDCWGSTPINPFADGDYSRPLTPQCLNCHSTWIDYRPGTPETFHRDTALVGVTCERCHGPGRDHVAYHEQHPQERTAQAIVHPGRLSRERLIDLCAQCHDNAIRFRRPPFTYRPGEVLSDYVSIPQFAFAEDNHVANQNGGMQASRCFQRSDALTCVTCHDPHQPRSPENAGAASCARCHQPTDCRERPRLPAAIQGDCVGCHMPPANKVQVNFRTEQEGFVAPVKRWEHRIAVYPEARDAVLLEWVKSQTDAESQAQSARLSASLGRFWRGRGAEYRGAYRFLMAIDAYREAQRFEPTDESQAAVRELVAVQSQLTDNWFRAGQLINAGRRAEAIRLLEEILSANPRMARAHGRLGTLYAAAGDRARGVRHLQQANELDPNDSYGHGMLGWLAYLDGQYQAALEHFERANDLEPMQPKLRYQLGLTLVGLERWPEAETAFRAALAANPQYVEACVGLTRVLLQRQEFDEAIRWARRAVELTSEQDGEAWLLLSDSCWEAGQSAAAQQAAERALQRSPRADSPLARRAQSRLDALQAGAKPARR